MSNDTMRATAEKLVAHCRNHTTDEGLTELYHPDALSVEAAAMPGAGGREIKGIAGIREKHAWWSGAMEIHSDGAEGPFVHGDDRFAVIFDFDATDRSTGSRTQTREVGIYTVDDSGKIVREEFFYAM